jgi:transcriptional regulator with XRE-family HTH domain
METETEKILEKIRQTRIEKNISILKLATNAGISHSHLYYIETKKVIPSIDVVVKIAKEMQIDVKEFFV